VCYSSVSRAVESNRIPPLKSYGQALEQVGCFPSVVCDCGYASANFLD